MRPARFDLRPEFRRFRRLARREAPGITDGLLAEAWQAVRPAAARRERERVLQVRHAAQRLATARALDHGTGATSTSTLEPGAPTIDLTHLLAIARAMTGAASQFAAQHGVPSAPMRQAMAEVVASSALPQSIGLERGRALVGALAQAAAKVAMAHHLPLAKLVEALQEAVAPF